MKKSKGFTLIELLAIIVILAIIAVITVPIILNVIDNAKRGTAKDSAYGYKDAINKYYVASMLEDESIKLNDTYNVADGKLGEYEIPFSGTKPASGYLTYENNVLTSGCLTIDEYKVVFANEEVTDVEVGECGPKVAYKCKRATELHTEVTNRIYTSGVDGFRVNEELGTTTIIYGNENIVKGELNSGDAFDCDVDGDGEYEETERFYYVSDLYNTSTKQFDSNYAVLVYYNNTTNGEPDNTDTNLSQYEKNRINYNGPIDAIGNLPTSEQWNNVSLVNSSRTILTENGGAKTYDGELTKNFSYDGYAARLLTSQEIDSACNLTTGSRKPGELDNCVYLFENADYAKSRTSGYWIETPNSSLSGYVWAVYAPSRIIGYFEADTRYTNATRPAIEVLKTDIEI